MPGVVHIVTRTDPGPGTRRIFASVAEAGGEPRWASTSHTEIGPSDVVLSRIRGDEPDREELLAGFDALIDDAPISARIINPPHAVRIASSKQHQAGAYRAARIPVPRTIRISESTDLGEVVASLGLPLIVKTDVASEGAGVHLVGSLADLENLVNLLSDRVVLAQTYVPDAAETLSMVVVGGQVVAAGRSQAGAGKWKTNANEGATWSGHYPSFRQADLAIHACESIGLDIGEVEVTSTQRGPLVIKVDPSPHLTVVERVTGVNLADIIARFCLEAGPKAQP